MIILLLTNLLWRLAIGFRRTMVMKQLITVSMGGQCFRTLPLIVCVRSTSGFIRTRGDSDRKVIFEDWIWNFAEVLANNYHPGKGLFISDYSCADCRQKNQSQSSSGVGAKQQDGKAGRENQTISYWARSARSHAALHWPPNNADSLRLWIFAFTHAAWLYNYLWNKNLG